VSPIPQIARNRFEVAAGNLVSATEASYRAGRMGDRFVSGRLASDRRSVSSRLSP